LLAKIQSVLANSEEAVFNTLLGLGTAVFMLQLLSLYSTPVPDSYLWWGDESWLTIEFRTQILHGVFRHPYALGSSLTQGSGFVLGNMWVPSIFYGIPAALVDPLKMDIVLLGRTVTAMFAFTLLIAVYEIVRRFSQDRLIALFSVILILTSRSFLFTSHSARYDMLNALAIAIGIYLLMRLLRGNALRLPISMSCAFITGLMVATSMLVTIHVTLCLMLAAFISILYRSPKKKIFATIAFFAGAISFVAILIGISMLRGQTTLFGSSGTNAFVLNFHDIPALRIYSRSVQFATLMQRLGTFSSFGMGYLTVFGLLTIVVFVKLVQKQFRLKIAPGAVIILAVLFSWLEFESAAPTSYLIYILPALSIAAGLILMRILEGQLRTLSIAVASIALLVFAFMDIPGVHGRGYRIMTENFQAVSAALAEIERPDSNIKPLVLAFNPAVHEVLRDTTFRLMTTHFIEFPSTQERADSLIRNEDVKYVLLYRSAIKPDYMREIGPISDAMNRIGTLVWKRPGYFTDIGRSYFQKDLGAPDTLQLYRIHD
jgi:hypothetical protein